MLGFFFRKIKLFKKLTCIFTKCSPFRVHVSFILVQVRGI